MTIKDLEESNKSLKSIGVFLVSCSTKCSFIRKPFAAGCHSLAQSVRIQKGQLTLAFQEIDDEEYCNLFNHKAIKYFAEVTIK